MTVETPETSSRSASWRSDILLSVLAIGLLLVPLSSWMPLIPLALAEAGQVDQGEVPTEVAIDNQFGRLVEDLPPAGRVGLALSPQHSPDERTYLLYLLSYALAPRIVVASESEAVVISTNILDRDRLARRGTHRPVKDYGRGLALFKRIE